MKILYVSDLDGTLLNGDQKVDRYVIEELNELINGGVNFTISTGRGGSVREILKDIFIEFPVMILNGALSYDFSERKYVDAKVIPNDKAIEIIRNLNNFEFKKFEIQTIIDDNLSRFAVSDWNTESDCLALNFMTSKEKMKDVSKILEELKGVNFFIHKKVYSNDEWFCDITPKNVSKASSLKVFKKKYGFDKVIAFGDSENDLPLAEIADEFYAVANATDIVKRNATGIIESCSDYGVVKFIKSLS